MSTKTEQLQQHYSGELNVAELVQQLNQKLPGLQPPSAFAAIDQLHLGGRAATLDLVEKVDPGSNDQYLDIGCGLGGSARLIAEKFATSVIGIDLTDAYCQLAEAINNKLQHPLPVTIVQGDISQLPFDSNQFSGVLSQHCLMNLPDVDGVLCELHRCLGNEGKLLLHEIVTTESALPIRYPVPWASQADQSHLLEETNFRNKLTRAGFEILLWENETDKAIEWRKRAGTGKADNPLSPAMVLGSQFQLMSENLFFNLRQGNVQVISAIASKVNLNR